MNAALRVPLAILVALALAALPATSFGQADANKKDSKKINKSSVLKKLTGNEVQRREGMQELDAYGDARLTAELLIEALDRDARKSGDVPNVVQEMLLKLSKIEAEEVTAALRKYAQVNNYKFAMIAVYLLGEQKNPANLDLFFGLWNAENFKDIFGFRMVVVHAVLKTNDKRAVNYAVVMLQQAEVARGILRENLLRYLHCVTEQSFGNQPEAWAAWWTDNHEDFEFSTCAASFDITRTVDQNVNYKNLQVSSYYGMKIYADRIVFVIDVSSSMWEDGPPTPNTRFEKAITELSGTLGTLPDGTHFSLLAFNAKITPWAGGRMVKADDKTRAAARKWVEYLQWGKGTNSHDALKRAFVADLNTESIMFLSDGKPSKGPVTDPNQILAVVKQENQFRNIAIFAIGVFTGGEQNQRLAEFMRNLAQQNNGVYREVN